MTADQIRQLKDIIAEMRYEGYEFYAKKLSKILKLPKQKSK